MIRFDYFLVTGTIGFHCRKYHRPDAFAVNAQPQRNQQDCGYLVDYAGKIYWRLVGHAHEKIYMGTGTVPRNHSKCHPVHRFCRKAWVLVEGWNKGWEDWKSFEFTTPYPDFDIAKITDYAAAKNIKLIGHHETGANTQNYERQMEDAFAWYQKYGVNMVKTGYVGGKLDNREMHGGQYGVRHYRKVIETAAKHRHMIDNHEPAMPTGLQRTFPNLMTQEWNAWSSDGGNLPDHTTTFPFTRGLAGPTGFTPVIFNFENTALPGTRVHTTLAKQLALFVVVYSPLQMAADMIENYEANPAPFEFIEKCPVNWDKR